MHNERFDRIEAFFGMNIYDFAFLSQMEPGETNTWRYIDLFHQGLNADEIDLELARERQAPLFTDPHLPLKHGQPGDPGSDWALIHDRSVENIRRAFNRSDRSISKAAKIMPHAWKPAHKRKYDHMLGITQQALSKLIKTPERMDRAQVGVLAGFLGCTLDYMRGLVDHRGQFYGSADTGLIAAAYEKLSPTGRALATEMLKSIACREAVVDSYIQNADRARRGGDGGSDGTADGT